MKVSVDTYTCVGSSEGRLNRRRYFKGNGPRSRSAGAERLRGYIIEH